MKFRLLRRPATSHVCAGAWGMLVLLGLGLLAGCESDSRGTPLSRDRASPTAAESRGRIVGYLPDYRVAGFDPRRAIGIDQLVFFSISVEEDGRLDTSRLGVTALTKLDEIRQATGCDVLLCVGGWGRSQGFSSMSASAESRTRFAEELIHLCQRHDFSGVDLDWEHPTTPEERHQLTLLLQQLQQTLRPRGLQVTVACAPWQPLNLQATEAADRIHLMSYDDRGRHSTLEQAEDNLTRWINAGVPAEKIMLGVPFYGRRYTSADRSARTYRELVNDWAPAPDVDEVDGYWFNGPETMRRKVELAVERGLGGIMIWELAQDTEEEETSLLRVIRRSIDRTDRPGS